MNNYEKFTRYIAKLEPGCAPSVGYFQEIIFKARQAIEKEKEAQFNPDAVEVLNFLNELAETDYKPNKTTLSFISARLKQGYTITQLKGIIFVKTVDWKNNFSVAKYLNYKTLFRESNIETYIQELNKAKQNPEKYKKYVEQLNKNREKQSAMSGSKSDWFV